jgi:pseudaminic acid cytidylyltransferase
VIIAVIPARGGSKRIPMKNIRLFAGKPMIGHSIEVAQRSGLFDQIVVSTDDPQISAVAREYGALVPFTRPAELADDLTGTTDVMAHAVDWLTSHSTLALEVCCIYATAPFIQVEDLREGLQILRSGRWRYVFAATRFAAPVQRAFSQNSGGGVEMLFPEKFNSRSQDLPDVLHDAGQFYWGAAESWLSRATIFDRQSTVVRIPSWRVQDIDTEEDWHSAEAMAMQLVVRRNLDTDVCEN